MAGLGKDVIVNRRRLF